MAKTYKTPGVYAEEVSRFPPSVAGVDTAIPAFMGKTQLLKDKKGLDIVRTANKTPAPIKISSFLEYQNHFGGPYSEHQIFNTTIIDNKNSSGAITSRKISSTVDKNLVSGYYMYYTIQMFFSNGGGPCYIVSTGDYSEAFDNENGIAALEAVRKVDEITMLIFTDKHIENNGIISGYKSLYDNALLQCKTLGDRIAIFDSWIVSGNPNKDSEVIKADVSNNNLEYGCAYYPWLQTNLPYGYNEDNLLIKHQNGAFDGLNLTSIKTIDANVYKLIKAEIDKNTIDVPPSGAVAGIMARIDHNRGVWKTPANESINMTTAPTVKVTVEQQELLNIDAITRKSINVIRFFTGKGTLIWGGRTLKGNDNEWRYISTRRFFNYVEESIKKSTQFVVFEPNDANTWIKIKGMCENFMNQLWRNGALQGVKPNEAFFVKVGLGLTMTALDILEGRMIVEIGMAVIRPAEFIIFKFSHRMQTA